MQPDIPAAPDAFAQTQRLREALSLGAQALRQQDHPLARQLARELDATAEIIAPPPEAYPELAEIDEAIENAIPHFVRLARHADEAEMLRTLKTLRRILLSDRRRIDPDPQRHLLNMAVILRQAWLIGHRCGLWEARAQLLQIRGTPSVPDREQRIALLEDYLQAQEGYGDSLRRELNELQARLMA